MSHLFHDQAVVNIMVKQYCPVSLADLMWRLSVYPKFLAVFFLPSSDTVGSHPLTVCICEYVLTEWIQHLYFRAKPNVIIRDNNGPHACLAFGEFLNIIDIFSVFSHIPCFGAAYLECIAVKNIMLKGYQFVGIVTQLWVIRDNLGKKIKDLGGESIQMKSL